MGPCLHDERPSERIISHVHSPSNITDYSNDFQLGDRINVVGTLEINKFGNMENVQFNLKDMKKSY